MPDGGVSWLHSAGLVTEEIGIMSFSANKFSFLHQWTNELADGAVAHYITHSIHIYNLIIIHALLFVIEMHM
jgi:hypothetical protein